MKQKNKRAIVTAGCLAMLIAVSIGLVQIYDRSTSSPDIEVFKEYIYLTSSNADTGLIEFLERNDGKIVYIDNFLDTSLAIEEHATVVEQCGVNIDAIVEKKIIGIPLILPVYRNINALICSGHYLVLNIGEKTTYEYSAGGTGLVMIRFRGFFEISATYHSGPSIYYHLKEIDVPFEVKRKFAQHQ